LLRDKYEDKKTYTSVTARHINLMLFASATNHISMPHV